MSRTRTFLNILKTFQTQTIWIGSLCTSLSIHQEKFSVTEDSEILESIPTLLVIFRPRNEFVSEITCKAIKACWILDSNLRRFLQLGASQVFTFGAIPFHFI